MRNFARIPISGSTCRWPCPVSIGAILDPRTTWDDGEEYDRTAQKLVGLFVDNFAEFEEHVDEGVRQAAPSAA